MHELRSTRAADCELHRAACLPKVVTEGLADSLQRDAAQNATDRERANPIRVVGLRMTRNLCRKVGRDNGRGRTTLDQAHEEFSGQFQPLIRIPQRHPVLKARARRARAGATRQSTDDLRDRRQDSVPDVVGEAVRRVRAGHTVPIRASREEVTKLVEDVIGAQWILGRQCSCTSPSKLPFFPKRVCPTDAALLWRLA